MISLKDLWERPTLSVPEAGQLLTLGRDAAYAAVERGEIPSLTIGRRKVVPTHLLLGQLLGMSDELIAITLGLTPENTEPDSPSEEEPGTATVHQLTSLRSGELQHAPNHVHQPTTPIRPGG